MTKETKKLNLEAIGTVIVICSSIAFFLGFGPGLAIGLGGIIIFTIGRFR